MKQQYKALIVDTILKEIRSKTLIVILVLTTVATYFGHLIVKYFTSEQELEGLSVAVAGGTLASSFWLLNLIAFSIATIFGVSVLRSDIQTKIIYQYLTFPINRMEYFLSRVTGIWLLVLGYYLYSYILNLVLLSSAYGEFLFSMKYLLTFGVLAVYLLIVIFIAIFFSLLLNKIGTLFIVFLLGIISSASFNTFKNVSLLESVQDLGIIKIVGLIVYYLFPRISFLTDVSNSLIFGQEISYNVIGQVAHLIISCVVYVYLAFFMLKKKDF